MDQNLRSNSWWFNVDPYPVDAEFHLAGQHSDLLPRASLVILFFAYPNSKFELSTRGVERDVVLVCHFESLFFLEPQPNSSGNQRALHPVAFPS